jgi:hypothetical protein
MLKEEYKKSKLFPYWISFASFIFQWVRDEFSVKQLNPKVVEVAGFEPASANPLP